MSEGRVFQSLGPITAKAQLPGRGEGTERSCWDDGLIDLEAKY